MATAVEEELSHVAIPLTAPPSADFFNETQWKVWFSLVDTIVPSLVSGSVGREKDEESEAWLDLEFSKLEKKLANPPSREAFRAYLSELPSETPAFKDHMVRVLAVAPKDMQGQIGTILSLLGCVVLMRCVLCLRADKKSDPVSEVSPLLAISSPSMTSRLVQERL
jgi:hypothetical protein